MIKLKQGAPYLIITHSKQGAHVRFSQGAWEIRHSGWLDDAWVIHAGGLLEFNHRDADITLYVRSRDLISI